jgi:hypothetical protein
MITIYQILLNGSDVARANAEGFGSIPAVHAKTSLMLGFKRWKAEYAKLFTKAYEVDTDDLEQAFESTNLWNDNLVTRVRRGSSTSVGDIAVKDGVCYFCDNFGWVAMGKYEGLN